jgi:hypothetical protein
MPRIPTGALLVLTLAILRPMGAAAQSNGHTLLPGDTVRVVAPEWGARMIQGELLLYHADSLAVREAATGTRYAVRLDGVTRLMKNEGLDRRRSVRRWGLAGLFMGFATGVLVGPLVSMERKDENFAGATLVTSLGGGALGLGLGAAGGSVFARDHWQRFRMPVTAPAYPPPAQTASVSVPTP